MKSTGYGYGKLMTDDQETMQMISAKLDARLGERTNGLQNEVPPGASAQADDEDGEHGPLGHDYRLANKYAEALAIGEPQLIDRAEFDRLVAEHG
ncbi:modification methylase HgiDII [Rhodococcus sp. 1168]|uniref:modification methylase HgiDII n=1 Tax=Rhodococcus sp. 1168 TaxID=2018041 RepID=UPI0020CB34A4|nr:modification methylase HgiDII [Rhodococcus sp. 1168]